MIRVKLEGNSLGLNQERNKLCWKYVAEFGRLAKNVPILAIERFVGHVVLRKGRGTKIFGS